MKEKENGELARFVFLIAMLAVVMWGGTVWKQLTSGWHRYTSDSHLFHHDKLMYVESRNWANSEYKDCVSLNVDLDQPTLTCDTDATGKVFMVRFDADDYDKTKPESAMFHWQCRKNGDGDPAITCEYQSFPSAPPKK